MLKWNRFALLLGLVFLTSTSSAFEIDSCENFDKNSLQEIISEVSSNISSLLSPLTCKTTDQTAELVYFCSFPKAVQEAIVFAGHQQEMESIMGKVDVAKSCDALDTLNQDLDNFAKKINSLYFPFQLEE